MYPQKTAIWKIPLDSLDSRDIFGSKLNEEQRRKLSDFDIV